MTISVNKGYPYNFLALDSSTFHIASNVGHDIGMGAVAEKVDFIQNLIQLFSRLQLDNLDSNNSTISNSSRLGQILLPCKLPHSCVSYKYLPEPIRLWIS